MNLKPVPKGNMFIAKQCLVMQKGILDHFKKEAGILMPWTGIMFVPAQIMLAGALKFLES